jgi:hypothetical protein
MKWLNGLCLAATFEGEFLRDRPLLRRQGPSYGTIGDPGKAGFYQKH